MKTGVIINYLGLAGLVVFFEYAKKYGWNPYYIGIEGIIFIAIIVSYILTYVKSGAWKFAHTSIRKQDERELEVTGNTLRNAYAFFSIIALSVMLVYSVLEVKISIIVVVSLIYLAHIIPTSIIAWKNVK